MKQKLQRWIPSAVVGLALSTSVGLSSPIIVVDTFDDGTTTANNMWNWYGGSTFAWDSSQDHTGNGGGSLHISQPSAAGDDTIIVPETFPGGGAWYGPAYDLTLYTNVSLWIKWDTANSTMGIDTFNTEGNGGMGLSLNDNSGWAVGTDTHFLPFQQVPDAASNGWVHLNFPISSSIPNIDAINAVEYYDWKPAPWSGTVAFWIDDVQFEPSSADVVPAPVIQPLVKTTPGLNVFASTAGVYDRQSALFRTNTATSWIGQASVGNPVSYSFTIASFPSDPATYGCEAWLFLSPNPQTVDLAPDWNETNMVIAFIQVGAGGATLNLQYKVNEDHQQAMYSGGTETRSDNATYTNTYVYSAAVGSMPGGPITNLIGSVNYITNESGNLGSITAPSALGTWTIKFTSDNTITLMAPGGGTTNLVIPSYNVGNLNPGANGMNIYLGMQPNNAAAQNQAVVYSSFSLSGATAAFSDNFVADSTLDTNAWSTASATGPNGVLVAPTSSAYWLSWTLPDGQFSSLVAPGLTDPSGWASLGNGGRIAMNGIRSQLISSSSLPAGNSGFFRLVKRTFTKLQVLLPGETAAPNTPTGKTGTPIAQTANVPFNVTVNAVDDNWNVVSSSDTVDLTASDSGNFFVLNNPVDLPMSGGTATFSVEFIASGSSTITATDTSDGSKTPGTSSTVTY